MYTLVVVDMQSRFSASNHIAIRNNVAREIKDAMNHNAGIVFLEFTSNGPTQPELIDLTMGYKHSYVALKSMDDGSKECWTVVNHYELPARHFRVVGVNTSYCVRATVEGLAKLYPEAVIDVIADACNCTSVHEHGLKTMEKLPQVIIRDNNKTLWSPS
jgi:nicotinamidase-related amidase